MPALPTSSQRPTEKVGINLPDEELMETVLNSFHREFPTNAQGRTAKCRKSFNVNPFPSRKWAGSRPRPELRLTAGPFFGFGFQKLNIGVIGLVFCFWQLNHITSI